MNFLEELEDRKANIEGELEKRLNFLKGRIPQVLFDSMEYSLLAGGKRIRPILLMEVASLGPAEMDRALPLALALEMIHTYSLIHDDLPAMDNDDLRRGKPTNHVKFGEQIAILAGDGLLNYAFETMHAGVPKTGFSNYVQAMSLIGESAGALGMVGGQADDVCNEGNIRDIQTLESINQRKTGALIKAAVLSGGILAGFNEETLSLLERYSRNMGLAFQIVDDILDVAGDANLMGKRLGNDADNHKVTYPAFYGLDHSREIVDALYKESVECLREIQGDTRFLIELTGFLCHRQF